MELVPSTVKTTTVTATSTMVSTPSKPPEEEEQVLVQAAPSTIIYTTTSTATPPPLPTMSSNPAKLRHKQITTMLQQQQQTLSSSQPQQSIILDASSTTATIVRQAFVSGNTTYVVMDQAEIDKLRRGFAASGNNNGGSGGAIVVQQQQVQEEIVIDSHKGDEGPSLPMEEEPHPLPVNNEKMTAQPATTVPTVNSKTPPTPTLLKPSIPTVTESDLLEATFPCPHCPRLFNRKNMVTRHVNEIHKVELPFKCDLCTSKSFAVLPSLQKHLMNYHDVDPEPYQCTLCKDTFTTQSLQDKHKCPYNKKTPLKKIIKRTATKKKKKKASKKKAAQPLICGECGKDTFRTKSTLLRHVTSHFKCGYCRNRGFRSRGELERHWWGHEEEDHGSKKGEVIVPEEEGKMWVCRGKKEVRGGDGDSDGDRTGCGKMYFVREIAEGGLCGCCQLE